MKLLRIFPPQSSASPEAASATLGEAEPCGGKMLLCVDYKSNEIKYSLFNEGISFSAEAQICNGPSLPPRRRAQYIAITLHELRYR